MAQAITFVKRSTLPILGKGKEGASSVSIGDNGQITFSTKATKELNGSAVVGIGFLAGKLYIFRETAKAISKVAKEDLFPIRLNKKAKTATFGASAILQDKASFGDHLYDYKASGNQTFPVVLDEKNDALVLDLPKGALAKKPVVARVKKPKSTAVGTAAPANGTAGVPVNAAGVPETAQEEEVILQ